MKKLWAWLKKLGIGSAALILLAAVVFGGFYFHTDPETTVVSSGGFPDDVKPGFTPDELVDQVIGAIETIRVSALKPVRTEPQMQLGPQAPNPPREHRYTSLRAPIPAFEQKIRGVSLGMLRGWAIQARAKHFVAIDTIATSVRAKRFSLSATLKDRRGFDFENRFHWSIPSGGEGCSACPPCAKQLAESILADVQPRTLVVSNNQKADPVAFEKTVQLYRSQKLGSPLKPDDYFAWADALRGTKNYDQAIVKYTDGLKQDLPRRPTCSAYDEIGVTYLEKYQMGKTVQDLDKADTAYNSALQCNPEDPIALSGRGNVFIRKWNAGGRKEDRLLEEGLSLNQQALKLDPGRVEASVNIGYVKYMRGDKKEALNYFRELTRKFPANAPVFLNFGFLLYREYLDGQDDLREAIEKTRHAWELTQDSYVAANNLGFFYLESDNVENALDFWREALKLNPADPDIVAGLALGLYVHGQKEESVRYYREALANDPGFKDTELLRKKHFWSPKALRLVAPLVRAASKSVS